MRCTTAFSARAKDKHSTAGRRPRKRSQPSAVRPQPNKRLQHRGRGEMTESTELAIGFISVISNVFSVRSVLNLFLRVHRNRSEIKVQPKLHRPIVDGGGGDGAKISHGWVRVGRAKLRMIYRVVEIHPEG